MATQTHNATLLKRTQALEVEQHMQPQPPPERPQSARRPPSAGGFRPQLRPQSSLPERPQSARPERPQSAQPERPQSARPLRPQSARPERPMPPPEQMERPLPRPARPASAGPMRPAQVRPASAGPNRTMAFQHAMHGLTLGHAGYGSNGEALDWSTSRFDPTFTQTLTQTQQQIPIWG
jgi:hypothetical protein